MIKLKTKDKIKYIICLLGILVLCTIFSTFFVQDIYAQSGDSNIAYLTEDKYSITNTDEPNGVILKEYAIMNYGKNATLSMKEIYNKRIEVSDSDDIIKIIPLELFKTVGVVQHIGKEYGFFIETRRPNETAICCFQQL